MEKDKLVENLQCTAESWWIFSITEILYQDDYSLDQISWWQKKCHMDMFQCSKQWYTLLIRATWILQRKTSVPNRSTFEIKHYIIHDEVHKGESGSPINISTDEQINKHFGKTSVQDERVCLLKLELMETTSLLKKEEMTPRLGGSTDMYWFMDSHFSVRKMVQDE